MSWQRSSEVALPSGSGRPAFNESPLSEDEFACNPSRRDSTDHQPGRILPKRGGFGCPRTPGSLVPVRSRSLPLRGRLIGGAPEDEGWESEIFGAREDGAHVEIPAAANDETQPDTPHAIRGTLSDPGADSAAFGAEAGWGADYDEPAWGAEYDDSTAGLQNVDYDESTWGAEYDDDLMAGHKQWVVDDPPVQAQLSLEEKMAKVIHQDFRDAEINIAEEREIKTSASAIEAIREASKPLDAWDMSWPGESMENGLPATAGSAAARAVKDPPLAQFPPGEPLSREFIVVIPEHAPADLGLRWVREVWPPEVDSIDLGYLSLWDGVRCVRPGDQLVQVDGERTALSAPPRVWEMLVRRPATYIFRRSILGHLEQIRQHVDGGQAPPEKYLGPAWNRNLPNADSVLFKLERARDRLDHGQAFSDDLDDDPDESEWSKDIVKVHIQDGRTLGLTFSREAHPPKVAKLLPLQMDWWHANGVSEGAILVKINGKSVRRSKPSDLAKMLTARPLRLLFKPSPPNKEMDSLWASSDDVPWLRKNAEIQMQNLEAVAVQARGAAELAEEARRKEAERVKRAEEAVLEAESAAKKQHLEFEAQLMRRSEAAAELADKLRMEETDRYLRMELEKKMRAEQQMHRMHKLADVARAASIEDQRRVRLEEKAHVAEMKAENAVHRAEEAALAFRAEEAEQEAEDVVMRQHAELRLAWQEEQTHEDFRRKIENMQKELALLDEVRGDLGPMRPKHEIIELTVTIFSALGLRDEDVVGRSDPFCECEIVGRPETKFQTRVVENTVNPMWNCEREMPRYKKGDDLVFTVYDKEARGAVRIGSAVLSNPEFHPNGFDGELVLADAARRAVAVLRVRVQIPQFFEARQENIKVSIFAADGLHSEDGVLAFDPFCLCKLLGKSAYNFRTTVVPQTTQPVWNHSEEMLGYCTGDSFEFLVYHQGPENEELLGKTSLACEQFLWNGFTGTLPLLQVGHGNPATLKVQVELRDLPKDLNGVSKFEVPEGGIGVNVTGDEPVGLVFDGNPPVIVSIQPGLEDDWATQGVYTGSTMYKINGVKTDGMREDEVIELLSKRPLSLQFDDVGSDDETRGKKLANYGKFGSGRGKRTARRKKRPPVKKRINLPDGRIKYEINSQTAMGLLFGGSSPPEVEGISPNLKEYWEQQGVRLGMTLLEVKDVSVQEHSTSEVAPLLNLRPLSIVLGPPVFRNDLVRITIISASGLRDADWDSKSDPFCVVQVPGKPSSSFQTHVIQDDRDPVWNYTHELTEFSVRDEDSLDFAVYDWDPEQPELLGQTSLALPRFLERSFNGRLTLQPSIPRPGDKPTLMVHVEAPVRLGPDGRPMPSQAASLQPSSRPSVKPAAKPSQRVQNPKVNIPTAAITELPNNQVKVVITGETQQTGFRMGGEGAPPSIIGFMPELKEHWESLGLQIGCTLLEVNAQTVETKTSFQVAPLLRKRPLDLIFQRPPWSLNPDSAIGAPRLG